MTGVTITVDSPSSVALSVDAPAQNVIDVSPAAGISIEVTTTGPPGQEGPAGPVGTTDHGLLQGLADDDHLQYALVDIAAVRPINPRPGTIWVINT
ncbi:MAG: hypothetical protein ACOYB3_04965 [Azonexus sp.]